MVDENQLEFANSIVVKIVAWFFVTWIHFYYAPNHNKSVKIVASQDLLN